jgi:hypothetical protein
MSRELIASDRRDRQFDTERGICYHILFTFDAVQYRQGGDMPETERMEEVHEAWISLVELAVRLGIMDSALSLPQYQVAAEGWRSRVREIRDWANRQIDEIQDFAEAWDDSA